MDPLLRAGLSNAVAACALAVVAAAVGYFCRRPAVRHALWLLVLLKLVTPPLVDVPVPWPADPAPAPAAEAPPAPAEEPPALAAGPEEGAAADDGAEPAGVLEDPPEPREEPAGSPPAAAAVSWRPPLLAAWLTGSAVWLGLALLRARRFARLLRYAGPAPARLRREAAHLARRLGLPAAPAIALLPGRVAPMLWGPAARLLLPAGLLARLDTVGRRTLLAHELAHLRRRDHWTRLFELAVTALFWWHPVVWWARRELREAEEQCCDAWVLWALPGAARTYALALVETVDFLSEARETLPAVASGMGHVRDLRRRVTMIMQGTTPRALTWGGLLTLFGLGGFLLPVMPTWAQQPAAEGAARIVVVAEPDAKYDVVRKVVVEAQDLATLKAELEKKRAELAALEAKLKAAQDGLAKGAAAGAKEPGKRVVIEVVSDGKRQQIALPDGSRVVGDEVKARALDALKKAEAESAHAQYVRRLAVVTADAKEKPQGLVIEVVVDGKRQVIQLPPGSRVLSAEEGGRPARVQVVNPDGKVNPEEAKRFIYRAAPATDADKRVADLEKRLDELMRAVKELRGELQKPAPDGAPRRVAPPTPAPRRPGQPGGAGDPNAAAPAAERSSFGR